MSIAQIKDSGAKLEELAFLLSSGVNAIESVYTAMSEGSSGAEEFTSGLDYLCRMLKIQINQVYDVSRELLTAENN